MSHAHDLEVEDTSLEDKSAFFHKRCRHQPRTSGQFSERHDETFYDTGDRCDYTDIERVDISKVRTPDGETHTIESEEDIEGGVSECVEKVEQAWKSGEMDDFGFDPRNSEAVAEAKGCRVEYNGRLD